jgi:hypothetical protein
MEHMGHDVSVSLNFTHTHTHTHTLVLLAVVPHEVMGMANFNKNLVRKKEINYINIGMEWKKYHFHVV